MKSKLIERKEIAELFGTTTQNLSAKAKAKKDQYDIIELGSICKKFNINEEDLENLLKTKKLFETSNISFEDFETLLKAKEIYKNI